MLGGVPAVTCPSARVGIDEGAALIEIGFVEQAGDRGRHEIRIGEVACAVGEGEALGLDDAMHGLDGERVAAEIERLDQRKHLADGHRAGGRRGGAAHVEAAIKNADRLAQLGAVVRKILRRERARPARIALHGGGDVAGDAALIEGGGTVSGDRLEGGGEGWVVQRVAFRPRAPGRIEEIGARRGGEARRIGLGEKLGEAGRDGESRRAPA